MGLRDGPGNFRATATVNSVHPRCVFTHTDQANTGLEPRALLSRARSKPSKEPCEIAPTRVLLLLLRVCRNLYESHGSGLRVALTIDVLPKCCACNTWYAHRQDGCLLSRPCTNPAVKGNLKNCFHKSAVSSILIFAS